MEAIRTYSTAFFHAFGAKFDSPILHNALNYQQFSLKLPSFPSHKPKFTLFSAAAASDSPVLTYNNESRDDSSFDQEFTDETKLIQDEKFDWYSHWYPVMPVCDLDKRRPHGKKVIGIDIVAWWDRNENEWKVFDDRCPHRLAPLSEGRIDQWGRLQCVYHGWCFGGSGDCKLIPQAPRDGPPIHTSSKACATVYPSCVQNGVLWFWPNTDEQYKDIFTREKPPFIEELDDPSFSCRMITRDIQYGYEVLIENLMDPSHVPYSHYVVSCTVKADREGGVPLDISLKTFGKDGFSTKTPTGLSNRFIPPCVYYGSDFFSSVGANPDNQSARTTENPSTTTAPATKRLLLVFICIPVSPGNSRLIFVSTRNFDVWIDRLVPRWIIHLGINLILDSDLYLLHVQEQKIHEVGSINWNKACFVPTKADVILVAFRRWLIKYSNGQVNWRGKYSGGALPPTPPVEQLMDRYWSHTVICRSCNLAYKVLQLLEIILQVVSIGSIGIVAAVKPSASLPVTAKYTLVSTAILLFVASKWLSRFIYKNFHFHDYEHAFR
ncbi:OLC1v1031457C2 [Oldenlandia corymbosa var. corymbosa]|uniref:OLC1v1031457C2 n=1 Tax=Oldenlandia corymbosa var. corymbosa TaxID=529605 RepID=A0AAV1CK55_OLDCO|nr:OLC1v1031457C2 [Oldenlandia corymbosa var. corymbosa]